MGYGKGQSLKVDKGFLIPKGVLKLGQVAAGIVCLVLVIIGAGFDKERPVFISKEYKNVYTYALATPIIWSVTSLVLFFLFLLSCSDRCGGKSCWVFLDLICDALATLMYLAAFILLAIYCGWPKDNHNPDFTKKELVGACVAALLACALYIAELVINVKARK